MLDRDIAVDALAVFAEHAAVAEISPGAERLALRGQHHCAATGVLVERFERAGDFLDQRDVEEVIRRAPDLDQRHMAMGLDADIFVRTHGNFPLFGGARLYLPRRLLDDQSVDDRNALSLSLIHISEP